MKTVRILKPISVRAKNYEKGQSADLADDEAKAVVRDGCGEVITDWGTDRQDAVEKRHTVIVDIWDAQRNELQGPRKNQ
jgi:hypothetical protein